jgi:hypothetical protein
MSENKRLIEQLIQPTHVPQALQATKILDALCRVTEAKYAADQKLLSEQDKSGGEQKRDGKEKIKPRAPSFYLERLIGYELRGPDGIASLFMNMYGSLDGLIAFIDAHEKMPKSADIAVFAEPYKTDRKTILQQRAKELEASGGGLPRDVSRTQPYSTAKSSLKR